MSPLFNCLPSSFRKKLLFSDSISDCSNKRRAARRLQRGGAVERKDTLALSSAALPHRPALACCASEKSLAVRNGLLRRSRCIASRFVTLHCLSLRFIAIQNSTHTSICIRIRLVQLGRQLSPQLGQQNVQVRSNFRLKSKNCSRLEHTRRLV